VSDTSDQSTSFAEDLFRRDRERFEREFERFLTSLETPVEARRIRAIETINRLGEIGLRLHRQGVL
jgi:hypothetical protein